MKTYFDFSKKERIGVIILSTVLLLSIIILNVGNRQSLPDSIKANPEDIQYIQLSSAFERNSNYNEIDEDVRQIELAPFFPNELDLKGWMEKGFSQKQAESILKYKKSYGPFEKKSDIQNLYVVSEDKFRELEPFLRFKDNAEEAVVEHQRAIDFPEEESVVKINEATTEMLIALPQIGPVYAERIVKFREKLGGFASVSQYEDLYISDDAKNSLRTYTLVDSLNLRKVDINNAPKEVLQGVPGSSWELVALIMKERDKSNLTDLNWLPENIISDEDLDIFTRYVNF